ncbi:MAG: rhodanese-like domain-containing protein [Candidatus Saccharibacteria bacterium]|nr:rhodanese-like domain-containing protein [Candidatus Saccharibacteria bacterium]
MPRSITAAELKDLRQNNKQTVVIDVLAPESYEARHIPGAINIPNGPELIHEVEKQNIDKDTPLVVYCSSATCGASPAAAASIEKAGFTNVADFDDGLAGWQDAGFGFEGSAA